MKKQEKEQNVTEVTEMLSKACALYVTDFTGVTVAEVNELRSEFRKAGIGYRVVKNTLARQALTAVGGYESVLESLRGPTSIVFGYDDPVSPAKIIKKFYDKKEKLKLKLCVLERKVYDGTKLDELARLPSKKEIIASVLASIDSSVTGVAGVIGGVMRDLVSVLDALSKRRAQDSSPQASEAQ